MSVTLGQWVELPEPLPIGPVWGDEDGDEDKDSLEKRGLLKAGTIVRMEGGKELLIGDMNEMLGSCDCCIRASRDDLVVAYYVIDVDRR